MALFRSIEMEARGDGGSIPRSVCFNRQSSQTPCLDVNLEKSLKPKLSWFPTHKSMQRRYLKTLLMRKIGYQYIKLLPHGMKVHNDDMFLWRKTYLNISKAFDFSVTDSRQNTLCVQQEVC